MITNLPPNRSRARQVGAALYPFYWAVVLVPLAWGCSQQKLKYETAEVSGKVMFRGTGLTGGSIMFTSDEGGLTGDGVIDQNGEFVVKNAPVGPVHITVNNRMLSKQATRGGPILRSPTSEPPIEFKGKFVAIPEKYYTVDKTDLTYTVTAGAAQTHDITLQEK
jgi:hypothetical protein